MVEQTLRKGKVGGSTPLSGSNKNSSSDEFLKS